MNIIICHCIDMKIDENNKEKDIGNYIYKEIIRKDK